MVGDMWCHFSWMQVTHRLPIDQWYDTPEYTHLDYPPLAAYLHYAMGYLFRYIDNDILFKAPIFGKGDVPDRIKYPVRATILALDVVCYYPIVLYVVLKRFKDYSKFHKVAAMLLLLNFPTYAFIEHTNTQANAPHLGLLLLSLHFLLNDRLLLTTICFTISICIKHILGPFVFPMAVYILAKTWHKHSKGVESVCY